MKDPMKSIPFVPKTSRGEVGWGGGGVCHAGMG